MTTLCSPQFVCNCILQPQKSGFRPQHSTITATSSVLMISYIHWAGETTLCCTVRPLILLTLCILLNKLHCLGLDVFAQKICTDRLKTTSFGTNTTRVCAGFLTIKVGVWTHIQTKEKQVNNGALQCASYFHYPFLCRWHRLLCIWLLSSYFNITICTFNITFFRQENCTLKNP